MFGRLKKSPYLCTRNSEMVPVVQLVRASDCGSECRGFESHRAPFKRHRRKTVSFFLFCLPYHHFKWGTYHLLRHYLHFSISFDGQKLHFSIIFRAAKNEVSRFVYGLTGSR